MLNPTTAEELAEAQEFSNRPFDVEDMSEDDRARIEKSVEAYDKKQKRNRQLYADRKQWQEYRALFPEDTPKTLSGFRRMKAADGERWEQLRADHRALKIQKVV
jgi:hypothetical protein